MSKRIILTECDLRNYIKEQIGVELKKLYCEETFINHEVNNDFKQMLCEELGVSMDVVQSTNEIIELIKEDIKDNKWYTDKNGFKVKENSIFYKFKNKDIEIYYRVINFSTEGNFRNFEKIYDLTGGYNKDFSKVKINIAMVNGGFVLETAQTTIQHELCHVLDNIYYSDDYIPKNEQDIYNIAVKNCSSPNKNKRNLGKAIYITFKTEQIAKANELDALLRISKEKGYNIKVEDTDEYALLLNLKEVINHFYNYKDLIYYTYNIKPDNMLKRLKISYRNYLRRLGRIAAINYNSEP